MDHKTKISASKQLDAIGFIPNVPIRVGFTFWDGRFQGVSIVKNIPTHARDVSLIDQTIDKIHAGGMGNYFRFATWIKPLSKELAIDAISEKLIQAEELLKQRNES